MLVEDMTYLVGTRVLLWRLVEEPQQLLALCREQEIPVEDLEKVPAKRQREKAAERLLLCRAFGRPVTLLHDGQGAPLVQQMDVNVSITHTMKLVALAWNGVRVIGLDAEQCDRKQVIKVRDKFLNDREKSFIDPDDLAAHIIAWTAKEAIIKSERNSALDWTEGICLEPFSVGADETCMTAHCGSNCYRLASRLLEGHYITLAVPVTDQYNKEA